MIGIDRNSKGLALAKEYGLKPIYNGIDGLLEAPELTEIVYEAASAKAHAYNAPILRDLGKKAIDLTPAAVGPYLVPSVNLQEEEIALHHL